MFIRRVLRALSWFCAAALLSCSRENASRSDSVPDAGQDSLRAPAATTSWAPELGRILAVPGDSDDTAIILYGEVRAAAEVPESLTLFAAVGDSAVTRVYPPGADPPLCGDAPVVRLKSGTPRAWSVGLADASARPILTDSIEALPSADSARFAADIARIASALPGEGQSRFAGIPFVVLGARRFVADTTQLVVAHLVRRVNLEASPAEEHTLIIGERPRASRDELYAVRYRNRSEGTEATAEHFNMLAGFQNGRRILLLLARDQDARTRYQVLERSDAGEWRIRWSRTLAC